MELYPVENKRRGMVTLNVTSTSKGAKRKREYIPRTTRRFQLRNDYPQDIHVAKVLDTARAKRREVTVIRNAVQLYHALEQGDLSMLFEMFPQYKSQFVTAETMAQLIASIQKQSDTKPHEIGQPPLAAPKAIAMPVFSEFDDDEPTVECTASAKTDCGANLLKGLSTLVH